MSIPIYRIELKVTIEESVRDQDDMEEIADIIDAIKAINGVTKVLIDTEEVIGEADEDIKEEER